MKYLLEYDNNVKGRILSKSNYNEIKELMIDFLFRFKDKFPSSSVAINSPMDILYIVMDFMTKYKFKPSKKLIKEYSESKLNETLGLPTFQKINEYTKIRQEVYDKLEKRYNSKPPFVYYFNPDYEISTERKISFIGVDFIAVGHLLKEPIKCIRYRIGACTCTNVNGRMIQAYFKQNEPYYYGREFCTNGDYYEGEWKDSFWNGDGVLETADGWRLQGQFVLAKNNGIFRCSKEDIEEIREYKDDQVINVKAYSLS